MQRLKSNEEFSKNETFNRNQDAHDDDLGYSISLEECKIRSTKVRWLTCREALKCSEL